MIFRFSHFDQNLYQIERIPLKVIDRCQGLVLLQVVITSVRYLTAEIKITRN